MPAFLRILIVFATACSADFAVAQSPSTGKEQKLILPTANNHIFSGDGEKFYMYVYRNFEGKESRPWTAGQYGFFRNMKRTEDGVIGTRFHEGIDIKPVKHLESLKDDKKALTARV